MIKREIASDVANYAGTFDSWCHLKVTSGESRDSNTFPSPRNNGSRKLLQKNVVLSLHTSGASDISEVGRERRVGSFVASVKY